VSKFVTKMRESGKLPSLVSATLLFDGVTVAGGDTPAATGVEADDTLEMRTTYSD
jgi:hypothetical protein